METKNNFKLEGLALEIFQLRYALTPEESWESACERVASHVVMAEKVEKQEEVKSRFTEILKENLFMPGGRIWYGSGRNKSNLMNCFVIEPEDDSREGWGSLISNFIVISGLGGGVGIPFEKIRPRGAEIKGTGGISSGSVSLMKIINAAANEIKGGGARRSACLYTQKYNHPDILEFLNVKLNLKELNNANISVGIDNKFIDAVEKNEEVELVFSGKVYGKYNASELFDTLLQNAVANGEPGILNIGLANEMNNIAYCRKLSCTNPCGELYLPDKTSCVLGSLVLPRFVNEDQTFDYQKLTETIITAVRFLDNVIDTTYYPLKEIEEETKKFRRIGLGFLGLHDMLLKMGLSYSSEEGLEFVAKVVDFIKKKSYEASTYLAAEKGAFPYFKKEEYLKTGFIKKMSPSLKTKIKNFGIRNCALNTVAPTGTTGIVCSFSAGIEPLFAFAYERTWTEGDSEANEKIKKSMVVTHPLFEEFVKAGKSVAHFESSHDISVEAHIRMQQTVQNHIDGSISKTINLPKDFAYEDLKPLVLKYLRELKGLTLYRDGSRGESPLKPLTIEEARTIIIEKEYEVSASESKCKSGVCEI